MEINSKLYAASRVDWRAWLAVNHESEKEIWIISNALSGTSSVSYLDAVEEAICFGWIDSIAKRLSDSEKAQRFSPRHRNSNWTELNKERARRLIRLGLMTEAGRRLLPDLSFTWAFPPESLNKLCPSWYQPSCRSRARAALGEGDLERFATLRSRASLVSFEREERGKPALENTQQFAIIPLNEPY